MTFEWEFLKKERMKCLLLCQAHNYAPPALGLQDTINSYKPGPEYSMYISKLEKLLKHLLQSNVQIIIKNS